MNSTEKESIGYCYPLAWISLLLGLAPVVVFFLAVFNFVKGETGFMAGWLMIVSVPAGVGLALVFSLLGFVARRFNKR